MSKLSYRAEVRSSSAAAITGSGGTAESGVIPATCSTPFSLIWTPTTAGTVNLTFEYAFSEDGTNFSDYATAFGAGGLSSQGDFTDATTEINAATVVWVEAPYYKVKITNNDSTAATVACMLNLVEDTAS